MYALGNIIQNSIIYAKNKVIAKVDYTKSEIIITIKDDGIGFTKEIMDKLGEPYISKNNTGMGLGIFISKNLIENMGGKILFSNYEQNGAIVEIRLKNSIL